MRMYISLPVLLRWRTLRPIAIAATITAILLIFTAGALQAPAGSANAAARSAAACSAQALPYVACGQLGAPPQQAIPAALRISR